jgi:hypothetical protein
MSLSLVAVACILAVVLEELFLRWTGLRLVSILDAPGEGLPGALERRREMFRKHYRAIRIAQFMFFGMLWIRASSEPGWSLPVSVLAQLTTILLLLQLVRVLGRRLVRSWSLLSITGLQQIAQASLVPLVPLVHGPPQSPPAPLDVLSGLFVVAAATAAAIGFSASVIHLLRTWSRGAGFMGEELPPLAAAEEISARINGPLAVLAALYLVSSAVAAGGPAPAPVLALIVLILSVSSLALVRDRRRLHHTAAMILGGACYPVLLAGVLAGLASSAG